LDKKKQSKKFEDLMLNSIDEAFSSLGDRAKASIYIYLEQKLVLSKQEIPFRIDDFSNALETIFGLAAKQLEILIMKKLYEKITCSYKWNGPRWLVPNLTFTQYVELLRLRYEDKGKIGGLEVWIDAGEKQKQYV
jgi:hypothetical protein